MALAVGIEYVGRPGAFDHEQIACVGGAQQLRPHLTHWFALEAKPQEPHRWAAVRAKAPPHFTH